MCIRDRGKQFALTTVLSTIIYPVLLGVMEGSGFGGFVLEEKLVAVLYAGLLIGCLLYTSYEKTDSLRQPVHLGVRLEDHRTVKILSPVPRCV